MMVSCFTSDHRTSTDPPLNRASKRQEYAGHPCRKRPEGKAAWPGRRQAYGSYTDDGYVGQDIITTADDQLSSHPLLQPIMKGDHRLAVPTPLTEVQRQITAELEQRPYSLQMLRTIPAHDVRISEALQSVARTVGRVSTTQGVMR